MTKKIRKLILSSLAVVTLASSLGFQTEKVEAKTITDITVQVDGEKIDFSIYGAYPYIENGTTMLPFRSIFEALEGEINTDMYNQHKFITFVQLEDNKKYLLAVKQNEKELHTQVYEYNDDGTYERKRFSIYEVPIVNVDGRLLVPVRAISECLGYDVDWDGNTRTVSVDTTERNIIFPSDTVTDGDANVKVEIPIEVEKQTEIQQKSNEDLSQAQKNMLEKNNITAEDKQRLAEEMLGYVNELRAENGLTPLELDQTLIDFAYLKAEDYRLGGYSDDAKSEDGYSSYHISPRYGSPKQWYNEIYNTNVHITENFAMTGVRKNTEAWAGYNTWENSEAHKASMLRPYLTKLGFGFYAIDDETHEDYGSTIMLLEMY